MRFAVAGALEYFLATVRHLCTRGRRPAFMIVPAEGDVAAHRRVAEELELELWVVEDLNGAVDRLAAARLDLLISIGWPRRLKKAVLDTPRLGCVNLHTSRLPDYRGRHPVHWAMILGEREIGLTLHHMSARFDEGDIILQDAVTVGRADDLHDVTRKLVPVGGDLLVRGLSELEAGTAPRRPQDPKTGRYLPRRTPAHSEIDWTKSSFEVARLVNTLVDPLPNAFTRDGERTVSFRRAFPGRCPGEVVARTTDGRYVIATGDGVVLVACDEVLEVGSIFGKPTE